MSVKDLKSIKHLKEREADYKRLLKAKLSLVIEGTDQINQLAQKKRSKPTHEAQISVFISL